MFNKFFIQIFFKLLYNYSSYLFSIFEFLNKILIGLFCVNFIYYDSRVSSMLYLDYIYFYIILFCIMER